MKAVIFMVFLLVLPVLASAATYTPSTETTCVGKTCTQTIYSGVRFADANGTLIEKAKSLKGVPGINLNIKQDVNFPVVVLDYNATHITLLLNVTFGQLNKNIPLQVYDTANTSKMAVNTVINSATMLSSQRILAYGLGKTLKFGFNSTTITLNESNGGNLGDAYADENYNFETGDFTYMKVGSDSTTSHKRIYMLFNLSVIPAGATITNANLSLFIESGSSTNQNILAYNSSNNWNEMDLRWSNMPAPDVLQNTRARVASGFMNWNVTNATIATYASVNKNMSILLKDPNEVSNYANVKSFRTKENTNATTRPQLVVTYTAAAGDSTPPTYNLVGTNNSNPLPLAQVLHYANWSDNVGLSGYIFSWNATGATCSDGMTNDTWVSMVGATNWSNVTKQMPAVCAGKTIDFKFFANDTSNNWNVTVDTYENETPGGGTTCDCASLQAGTVVNCAENCDLGACDASSQVITFTGAGTITTSGNVVNFPRAIFSSGCTLVIGAGKRWG